MVKNNVILLIFVLSCTTLAQSDTDGIKRLQEAFISFDYPAAILIADSLLDKKASFNHDELITIYLIKGISQYSEGDETGAGISFIHILQYEQEYELDPLNYSPKIVNFFDQIKIQFAENFPIADSSSVSDSLTTNNDSVKDTNTTDTNSQKYFQDYSEIESYNSSSLQSVLLPGLGHLSRGKTTKGIILTTATVASLGSSIYYYFETQTRRNAYLNETEKAQIPIKYTEYNDAYKMRNASVAAFLVVWLYTQLDYFLIQDDLPKIQMRKTTSYNSDFMIDVSIPF